MRLVILALALTAPALARADYTVSLRRCTATITSGCTTYTRPYNWATDQSPLYLYTTYVADKPRLDESRPPDQPFASHFTGTATAEVTGMAPGRYAVRVRFRRTPNRTRCAHWRITSDGAEANTLQGSIDQRDSAELPDTGAGTVGTYDLPETRTSPLQVLETMTVVIGSNTHTPCFNGDGSVAYGGVVLVRVGDLPPGAVATPTIVPPGGTFTSPQTVTLASATTGAAVHYTTDGSLPTTASALYAAPITLSASARLRARAFAAGQASQVAVADFVIEVPLAAPEAQPPAGSYHGTVAVTLTAAAGEIRYTLDDSDPVTTSTAYGSPIVLASSAVVRARAFRAAESSAPLVAPYTVLPHDAALPDGDPDPGGMTSSGGCGCGSASGALALAGLVLVRPRRRRRGA